MGESTANGLWSQELLTIVFGFKLFNPCINLLAGFFISRCDTGMGVGDRSTCDGHYRSEPRLKNSLATAFLLISLIEESIEMPCALIIELVGWAIFNLLVML